MNVLVLPINNVAINHIFFLDSKKNILMDGVFTKITYINEWFTMNGMYINLPIDVQNIDYNHVSGQKHTIYFSVSKHADIIYLVENLERVILEKYSPSEYKPAVYSIANSLRMGYFKIFKESGIIHQKTGFALKISGIWENIKGYGLSYKIMDSFSVV